MKIYIGFFVGVFFLYTLYKWFSYKNQKPGLGALLWPLPKGLKNAESLMYAAVFLLCVGGAIWYPIENAKINYEGYLFAALMGFFSANSIYPIIIAFTDKGLYERGIISMSGIAPYEKFTKYQIIERKNGKIQLILFPHNKYFGKIYGFITHERDKKQLEKVLKNKLIQ